MVFASPFMQRWLHSKHPIRLAFILWGVYALVVCIIVARDPHGRQVTSAYRFGSEAFAARQEMYPPGLHGWLYPPHSALALMPITWPPFLVGEILWRILGMAALSWATWRLWRTLIADAPDPKPTPADPACVSPTSPVAPIWRGLGQLALTRAPLFLLMSAVVMITAAGSSRTGQVNSLLGAGMALCALALAERRWWAAALWLALGFAVKPQALPMMLVAGVLFPVFGVRMLALSLALFALPWLFAESSYVWQQHLGWYTKMRNDATPEPGTWADICGLAVPILKLLHLDLPERAWTLLRITMAPLTLAASWWFTHHITRAPLHVPTAPTPTAADDRAVHLARFRSALVVLALCAAYVMLFNPRTEGNTYALFGPVAGVIASLALVERRWSLAIPAIAACVGLMFSRELTLNVTNFWVRPLCAIVITLVALALAARWAKGPSVSPATPSIG